MISTQSSEPPAGTSPVDPIAVACVVRPSELVVVSSANGTPVASRQVCPLHREVLRVRTESLGGAAQVSAEALRDEVPLIRCEVDGPETSGRLWLDVRCTARATGKVELYSRSDASRVVDPRSFVATIYACTEHGRSVSAAGVAAGWHGAETVLPVSTSSHRLCGEVVDLQRPLRWPTPVPPPSAKDLPAHRYVGGSTGGPGECGVECTCGTSFDGFDSIAEAKALLDEHIAEETGRPAPVRAADLHGGLWIATGDPDEPGIEIRHVETSDDGETVGVLLVGPSYREYQADETVRLVDRATVDEAREQAAQRRRRTAMSSGLRALADLFEARPDLLPKWQVQIEGYAHDVTQVVAAAELIGVTVQRRYRSAAVTWHYGATEVGAAPVIYTLSATDPNAPADDPIPAAGGAR